MTNATKRGGASFSCSSEAPIVPSEAMTKNPAKSIITASGRHGFCEITTANLNEPCASDERKTGRQAGLQWVNGKSREFGLQPAELSTRALPRQIADQHAWRTSDQLKPGLHAIYLSVTICGRVLSITASNSFCSLSGIRSLSSEAFRSPIVASNSGLLMRMPACAAFISFPSYFGGPPVARERNWTRCVFSLAVFVGVAVHLVDSSWPKRPPRLMPLRSQFTRGSSRARWVKSSTMAVMPCSAPSRSKSVTLPGAPLVAPFVDLES